jgi:GH15 family glucan-1,4-alpha-glucosidase
VTDQPPISDYAIIGDCRSAALVSLGGSIVWLCLPRFDSPSVFAAILDARRGGRFLVGPAGPFEATRTYIAGTNVLQTTFTTPTGVMRLTDVMPVDSESAKARELWPEHEVLRKVDCLAGHVTIEVLFDPRFEYGRIVPRFSRRHDDLYYCEHATTALAIRSGLTLRSIEGQPGLVCTERMDAGRTAYVSMTYAHGMPAVVAPLGGHAERRIERSIHWWTTWASACRATGPHRDAVLRSALALKLLSYSPSGAIVAAPTTSLPEKIGGVRNWDYRYCWLRDASLTLRALCGVGFDVEAESFLSWQLHATHLTWPRVGVVYGVYGEPDLKERELAHLSGYAKSAPVRIGNLAADQLQLDTYGEIVESAYVWVTSGGSLDSASKRNLRELGEAVCKRWGEPDDGIWERRAARRHHTHAKAMCWLALDRLLKLHASGHLRIPAGKFAAERDAIRRTIETRGYNEQLGSYVSVLDGDELDASLLTLALHGYADARSPRMRSTLRQIRERLGVNGFLYRYLEQDGLPPGEGAFGICGFWAVECLALAGERAEASRLFETLLASTNDVGLCAEEVDPVSREALGNFPQGLTHVGLINAALALERNGR